MVAEDRGVDPETLGDARSWDFAEWGIDGPDEFDRLHRLAVLEHRMFRHMPPAAGGGREPLAAVRRRRVDPDHHPPAVRELGPRHRRGRHRRLARRHRHPVPRHLLPRRQARGRGRLLRRRRRPTTSQALREAGNHVIVFDAPYNRDVDGPRAASWAEVEALVLDRVAEIGVPLQPQLPGVDPGSDRLTRRVTHPWA